MFAFLKGIVARKTADHVELDVNGVGYLVYVSDRTHARLGVDQPVTLLTYCHIREEAFQIFGFSREEEKALFLMLLGVSGVGPKVALAVVSGMSPQEFGRAIHDNDVTAFTKIGGVGKKTGQRIVLELSAKLGKDAELDKIIGRRADVEEDADSDDVLAALLALGCTPAEAKKAASQARDQLGKAATDEELVRAALRSLAKV